jgi:hypothetical protein
VNNRNVSAAPTLAVRDAADLIPRRGKTNE